MADVYHLSFSIGPVQGFVAQARRTRDLWAGSWLLSYLAECALVAAEDEKIAGEVLIPHREKRARRQVTSKKTAVGGIPNRFEMRFSGDEAADRAKKAAKAAENAFHEAWRKVAEAVWDAYVKPIAHQGNGTRGIWERQVASFWELSWVVGEPDVQGTIGRLAAMRKNFRDSGPNMSGEAGAKCSLMPTMQEISGHLGRERDTFWRALRDQEKGQGLNLGDTERLCAISLIKRLFPYCLREAIGDEVDRELDQVSWPSTAFMAAIPWLQGLSEDSRKSAKGYQERAIDLLGYQKSEWQAARDAGVKWAEADGPIWFSSAIRNDEPGREKLGHNPTEEEKQERRVKVNNLLKELDGVYQKAGGDQSKSKQKGPVPYYALLLMDGDSMGELVGKLGSPQQLSECLGTFAGEVEGIVKKNHGRTVYAGGDDVLALVPASYALDTAEQLCVQYEKAFANTDAAGSATISAAIVYAHWRYPLRRVLRTAHRLLDDVAKDRTGRDSVALGIILGSGLNAVWSVPWSVLHGQQAGTKSLLDFAKEYFGPDDQANEQDGQTNERDDKVKFNASYLYLLRERFVRLFDDSKVLPGEFRRIPFQPELLRDLAHGEYRRRMSKEDRQRKKRSETEPIIDQLMSLSREWKRNKGKDGEFGHPEADPLTFAFDGWRVARFLRQLRDGKVADHD